MAYQLFMDGFDHYATADITKKWSAYAGGVMGIYSTGGRRNGGRLYMADSQSDRYVHSPAFTASTHVTIGFAVYIANLGYGFYVDFYSASGAQFRFTITTGNKLQAGRGGATADKTSDYAFPYDAWQYVECGVHVADSGSYEVRLNGSTTPIISNVSYDTARYSGEAITSFRLSRIGATGPGITGFIDDLYFAYGDEIKFMGDSRVDALALTGNSTPQDWTPDTGNAWERLNQDAGFISSSTVDAVSLFASGDISHNPTAIHGIQLNGAIYKSDAGSREAALVLKSGATTSVGTSKVLSTSSEYIRSAHIVDPNTGSAFTKSNLNAIEVGAKVTA